MRCSVQAKCDWSSTWFISDQRDRGVCSMIGATGCIIGAGIKWHRQYCPASNVWSAVYDKRSCIGCHSWPGGGWEFDSAKHSMIMLRHRTQNSVAVCLLVLWFLRYHHHLWSPTWWFCKLNPSRAPMEQNTGSAADGKEKVHDGAWRLMSLLFDRGGFGAASSWALAKHQNRNRVRWCVGAIVLRF